jgi:hypothetical protein
MFGCGGALLMAAGSQREESISWAGSRQQPIERQRHLSLYQQAFDSVHHAMQVGSLLQ